MKKVAILLADLFEDNELFYPYYRLQEDDIKVDLIGAKKNHKYKSKHGQSATSDCSAKDVSHNEYDAVIIPGGYSPDHMRRSDSMREFVSNMFKDGKTIAAICHGPWMMISCCDVSSHTLTGFFSIKDDIVNAGASYVDQEVVVDGQFITSRTPDDLPVFTKTILKVLDKR